MGSLFDEIQQRAEKLNTNVRLGDISEIRLPSASTTQQVEGISGAYASSLETSLDDIFRRSEEIWNRKQSIRPVAGMGPTLRATKDLSQLDSTQLVAAQQQKRKEAEKPIEYEGVSKAMEQGRFEDEEVNKYVQRAFERARIEAERTFLNQQILEKPASATSTLFSPKRQQQQPGMSPQKLDGTIRGRGGIFAHLPRAPLLHEQNVFAQKIDVSLTNNCNELLTQAIREAVKKLNTKEADYIWSKVFAIFPKTTPPQRGRTVREMRSEKQWLDSIIESGTQYLQNEMEAHMEASIEANLARARRGGIPGTLSRIEAYLNVRQAVHPVYEDGLFNSHHPKWAMLFCCLRVGDLQAASRVAETLKNIPQCAALVNILVALPRLTTNIDDDRRIKLRAEWKQSAQGCQDVHKKAVYGLFLGFDSPEANETIEDWLWARLFACKYAPESGRTLHQLQTTICAQHGERYFVNEGGSHLLYFAVLLLTGQIERAAHVLFKSEDHRVHGVHIALLAHQLRLLLCTNKVSDDILIQDVHEPSVCQLNLARLVLLYVKDFELSNVNYALNYCFLLRDFQLNPVLESKVTRTVFEACVSRIVFLSGERAAILGQLNQRGERVPGLIDKFSAALNISDVIARVAFDTNVQADPLGACHLYALANRRDDANKLISFQLSQCISNPSQEQTLKAVECAHWLAKRHDRSPEEDAQFATLKLLLDLHTFFLHASEGRHQEAVQTVQQRLRFVPTDPDDVQTAVAHFFLVPEEVRPLLPAICSQLMRSIVALHQAAAPVGSPATLQLRQFAKALILYTAMIPYRFPVSTNSLLLQLQSKIV